ncbi:ABC transporter permease [Paludifilum halophilum]|uniref:ABC transporter permease n=1 Tax=Paludifilum halophilum TaxID=1642702 RepID=UPI001469DE4F|nr:ABC transporter permease [Paludifilum halophilum]
MGPEAHLGPVRCIPLLLYGSVRYLAKNNVTVPKENPEYAVVDNFPVLGLAEMLVTAFNGLLVLWLVLSVTQEYRTGQLRMVMLRSYSAVSIFAAKWVAAVATLLLYLGCYLGVSYLVGTWMLPNTDTVPLFFHGERVSGWEAFLYNLQFYGLAALTLVVTSAVIMGIAVASPTTTTAVGVSLVFLLTSIAYSYVLHRWQPSLDPRWSFLSLTEIQYQGITRMLAEQPMWIGWNLTVMAGYTLCSLGLVLMLTYRHDHWT